MDQKIDKIIEVLQQNQNGLSPTELTLKTDIKIEDLSQIINELSAQKRITLLKNDIDNQLVVKLVDDSDLSLMDHLTQEEYTLYQLIKQSQNKGVWMKDLLRLSGLHRSVVTKSVKNLINLNHIKCISSIKHPAKKIYICSNIVPDSTIVGGLFYNESQLDTEFVRVLSIACSKYIQKVSSDGSKNASNSSFDIPSATGSSVKEVFDFIQKSSIIEAEIGLSDIEQLLDMLVFDKVLIKYQDGNTFKYKIHPMSQQYNNHLKHSIVNIDSFSNTMPCSACPVFNDCSINGLISPMNCQYMKDWLEL